MFEFGLPFPLCMSYAFANKINITPIAIMAVLSLLPVTAKGRLPMSRTIRSSRLRRLRIPTERSLYTDEMFWYLSPRAKIPLDQRHQAKVDYVSLHRMLQSH